MLACNRSEIRYNTKEVDNICQHIGLAAAPTHRARISQYADSVSKSKLGHFREDAETAVQPWQSPDNQQ